MSSPSVVHRTYSVPRDGAQAAEYEDAAAVRAASWPVCAAVADGATESAFAGVWARQLVRGVVDRAATTVNRFRETVVDRRRAWQSAVTDRVEERPWYVAAKAADGAYATVLGISLHADGRWRALSVGDCCLFQVRDGARTLDWPVDSPDAFTNRPALVASRAGGDALSPATTTGTWTVHDRFVLATDAVAAWLMKEDLEVEAIVGNEAFRARVEAARAEGRLRNDDATLLVLTLTATPPSGAGAEKG